MQKIRINLIGKKFGKLKVIKFAHLDRCKNAMWLCQCDCGKQKAILGTSLRNNKTKSCGCGKSEFIRKNKIKHSMCGSRFYRIWANRWLNFQNFRDDMFKNYQKHCNKFGEKQTTLDRMNPNGNYEPSNCRWATWKEQRTNQE